MKIIDLEEFKNLPDGTIFCEYMPLMFGDLSIKYSQDQAITVMPYFYTLENNNKLNTENEMCWDIESRKYDDDQWFAIFDEKEINYMKNILDKNIMKLKLGYSVICRVDDELVTLYLLDENMREFALKQQIEAILDDNGVIVYENDNDKRKHRNKKVVRNY